MFEADNIRPGDLIAGRFRVETLIARGGMGLLYRGTDTRTGLAVAIKSLPDRADPDDQVRFRREAEMLAELRHPAIVEHIAHGETAGGLAYLVMEWLEGEDLGSLLRRERVLGLERTREIGLRVADALACAHERGVVHRDVKPANILIVGQGLERLKLIDFGLARRGGLSGPRAVTKTGLAMGTPAYMAPEQARGVRELDVRVDVFSLGCVLFECLTGRPPFLADDFLALLAKVVFEEPPRLHELLPDAPAGLDELLSKMLAKDLNERLPNARVVREALAAIDLKAVGDGVMRRSLSFGHSEQRRLFVLLVRMPRPEAERDITQTTIDPGQITQARAVDADRLTHPLARFPGAQRERLADGTEVLTVEPVGNAQDQAADAARMALALKEERKGAWMAMATGSGALRQRLPVGQVIDRATALLRQVEATGDPSGVAVDPTTSALFEARFFVESGASWGRLHAELTDSTPMRLLLGRPTPFVGRRTEMAALMSLVEECQEESRSRSLLVTAPPGAGKSRLLREFLVRLQGAGLEPNVWTAAGHPLRDGSSFALLRELIVRIAGILPTETDDQRRGRLRDRVAQHVSGPDVGRVTEFLSEMMGLSPDARMSAELAAARREGALMAEQIRLAWEDFVEAEARAGLRILVLDDLQWADLPSIRLLDAAVRRSREAPVFVLALARPQVHERFPELFKDQDLQQWSLPPLSRRASEELVRSLLGRDQPRSTLDRVIGLAEGNAFHLEELIRSVAMGQVDALPETLVAMAQLRVQALPDLERRVLRAASLFGEHFWPAAVADLIERDPRDAIRELVQKELLVERPQSRFPGHAEYVFRHALLREAVESTLTTEDHQLGSRLAGQWLEAAGESDPTVLAAHFDAGGVPHRARHHHGRAAQVALEGHDLQGALRHAERAIELGATDTELGELLMLLAEAHHWGNQMEEAGNAALAAMRQLIPGSERWYAAATQAGLVASRRGWTEVLNSCLMLLQASRPEAGAENAELIAYCRLAFALAEAHHPEMEALRERIDAIVRQHPLLEPAALAQVHSLRWRLADRSGLDCFVMVRESQLALEEFERAGDVKNSCVERTTFAYSLTLAGDFERAEHEVRRSLAEAQRLGSLTENWARLVLAVTLGWRGTEYHPEARSELGRVLERFRATSYKGGIGYCLANLVLLEIRSGDPVVAEQHASEAVALLAGMHDECFGLVALADALLACFRAEEAVAVARRAVERVEAGCNRELRASSYRVLGLALSRTGHKEEARGVWDRGVSQVMAEADQAPDEVSRRLYLAHPDRAALIERHRRRG